MITPRPLRRFALIPLVGAATYAIAVQRQVSAIPLSNVSIEDNIPQAYRNSETLRQIVNPRNVKATGDAYSTTLDIPSRHRDVSDETLLAWYLKGFFESRVFAVERTLLKTVRPREFTKFSALPSSEAENYIWATREMAEQKLPPLHTKIFGIFQILSIQLPEDTKKESSESIVDVGFGSDTARFAGCHRLSIVRTETQAHLHLACTSCNPTDGNGPNSGILRRFHRFYAMMLFRAAVTQIKQRMEMPLI